MKEKIGYPDYILNATALNIEYNNIRLNQTVFLGKLKSIPMSLKIKSYNN